MPRTLAPALAASLAVLVAVPAEAQTQWRTLSGKPTLVVGHRGASGYLPEHTLEAYKLAIEQGADFVEPDLTITKDGVLIARHEPMLGGTTDVADRPEFASRKTTRKVDGADTTDWFASDFTLAEIKTLRAKQALAERDQSHNGKFLVPTLDEVIALVKAESARTGRTIGIYPETKHPTFHTALGLPLEAPLLATLAREGWTTKTSPVIVQSFETANLKAIRPLTQVRLAQLVDADDVNPDGSISLAAPYAQPYDFVVVGNPRTFKDLVTKEGLAEVRTYADIIAPWKPYLVPTRLTLGADGKPVDRNGDGRIDERDRSVMEPTSVITDAHALGLEVHSWTFRNEPRRLAADFQGDPAAEYRLFYSIGLDGLFSDFPDTAVKAR